MGILGEILFQIGRVIFGALLNAFAGEALGWLFRRLGRGFGAGVQLIESAAGRDRRALGPAAPGTEAVTCAACGAPVPRQKFCTNCGRLLKIVANPAPK